MALRFSRLSSSIIARCFQNTKFSKQSLQIALFSRYKSIPSNNFVRLSSRPFTTSKNEQNFVDETNQNPKLEEEVPTSKVEEPEPTSKLEEVEIVKGDSTKHEFQAETRKLLDIVARSLYIDKEVFIREIISNASDALEKLRHVQITGEEISDSYLPQEIHITTDEAAKTITIQDYGVGLSKQDLIDNLGTIARSGTEQFLKQMKDNTQIGNMIGQFGVGFYSSFMVAKEVKVFSRSYTPDAPGYLWSSDGSGTFAIAEADNVTRGAKVIIYLKDDAAEFAKHSVVERIIKKYSNFVSFDILLNGEKVNTIKAIWLLPKDKVTRQEHVNFYQFISHSYDEPLYWLHYSVDSPITVNSVFYIPTQHSEKYGLGKMEPGVNLFSRKVLIQSKAQGLLPDWLRFVKGVVDSPDIPLNISREQFQDSNLIKKLNTLLTRRLLKFCAEEAKNNPANYEKFFKEFGGFLKEGICTQFQHKEEIGKLLRMESSFGKEFEVTSLDDYVERAKPEQKEIFYLCVPSRALAESSPYFEGFKLKNIEVLFLYTTLDDFVMNNLSEYSGKKLVSIESSRIESSETKTEQADEQNIKDFVDWLKIILGTKVHTVKTSTRLVNSPAIIVDHESASFRRMMKFVDPERTPRLPKQQLEINPNHPIMIGLNTLRVSNPPFAKLIAEQILDNALMACGLMDDGRSMLSRLNEILVSAIQNQNKTPSQSVPEAETIKS